MVRVPVAAALGFSAVGRMQAASAKSGMASKTSENRTVLYRGLKALKFSPVRTGRGTRELAQQPPEHYNHTLAFSGKECRCMSRLACAHVSLVPILR
jgi:hypothetical protein